MSLIMPRNTLFTGCLPLGCIKSLWNQSWPEVLSRSSSWQARHSSSLSSPTHLHSHGLNPDNNLVRFVCIILGHCLHCFGFFERFQFLCVDVDFGPALLGVFLPFVMTMWFANIFFCLPWACPRGRGWWGGSWGRRRAGRWGRGESERPSHCQGMPWKIAKNDIEITGDNE